MTNAWQIASVNFREHDGSLPTVVFDQLKRESVKSLYQFIRENGQCVSESATVWDNKDEVDVPLMSLDDPCGWLQDGRADPFHCCFGSISMYGTVIPDLGVAVFRDSVEIDFQMGMAWNPRNVDAFFQFLAYLKSLATESTIRSGEIEGLMDEASFLRALRPYLDEGGGTKR